MFWDSSWIQSDDYDYIWPTSHSPSSSHIHTHYARTTIMSDNDGAGFSPSQFVWASQTHDNNDNDSNDDDDVMVTMNNCETTALASLSLFSLLHLIKTSAEKKSVMWNLTWSKLRYAFWASERALSRIPTVSKVSSATAIAVICVCAVQNGRCSGHRSSSLSVVHPQK